MKPDEGVSTCERKKNAAFLRAFPDNNLGFKNIFLVLIILTLSSFYFIKHTKSIELANETALVFHSIYSYSDSNKTDHYKCDDFVSNALNNYTITSINTNFTSNLKCSKEPVANHNVDKEIDTIYTFSDKKNIIQIYRTKQREFMYCFDVTDSKFYLRGNIKTGMSKDDFSRKFKMRANIDNTIEIANSEGNMNFQFYFKNNVLKRINSSLYLD